MELQGKITQIKGLGAKRAELFNALEIYTIYDLLTYYPRAYEDRTKIVTIEEAEVDQKNNIKLRLKGYPTVARLNNNLSITKVKATDGESVIELTWFNQPYLKNNFDIDKEYVFTGKVTQRGKFLTMESPEYEAVIDGETKQSGRIIPVYRLTYGLSQKLIRGYILDCLDLCEEILEFYPQKIIETFNLLGIVKAIRNIHYPETDEMFKKARRRLVFDEIFFAQLVLSDLKSISNTKSRLSFENLGYNEILEQLPFSLTNSQNKVLEDIKTDIVSGKTINRLVQGDVGSGKTVLAIISSYLAIKNGYQSALMAPTEVLARQHYNGIKPIFDSLGIKMAFLSGSIKQSEKKRVYEELASGEVDFVVGTHAIIQKNVEFKNLGFVTTDEQHRFGVKQRATIVNKGEQPHTLVMTATPIPRTLALILYGDLDISINGDMPPNRKAIDTFVIKSELKQRMFGFYDKEVRAGRQVYVICPLIEDNETSLLSAVEHSEILKEVFPQFKVECLHGKMKQTEKDDIMQRFADNEINILVSTTVIEVGINVPNATIMTIENAERFGLSQLHQLRGRVGRGEHQSYCILVSDSKTKQTKDRLKIMTESNDGFYIAEKDLELRGEGDFFGTRQHGVPDFKIANLYEDTEILQEIQSKIGEVTKFYQTLVGEEKVTFNEKLEEVKLKFDRVTL